MVIECNYCPQCKTKMVLKEGYPNCPSCKFTMYKNSIPCVGMFIVNDDKVLLHKRNIEPFKGAWDIIGGILNNGEHPLEGIKREVKEETALNVEPIKMLGTYMDEYGDGRQTLNVFYIGKIVSGEMKPNEEVLALKWFDIQDIVIKKSFKSTIEALQDLKKWHKHRTNFQL